MSQLTDKPTEYLEAISEQLLKIQAEIVKKYTLMQECEEKIIAYKNYSISVEIKKKIGEELLSRMNIL
jgi:hypothetical protein